MSITSAFLMQPRRQVGAHKQHTDRQLLINAEQAITSVSVETPLHCQPLPPLPQMSHPQPDKEADC